MGLTVFPLYYGKVVLTICGMDNKGVDMQIHRKLSIRRSHDRSGSCTGARLNYVVSHAGNLDQSEEALELVRKTAPEYVGSARKQSIELTAAKGDGTYEFEVDYAPPEFNARFSAKGKAYIYVVNTGDLNPFTSRWSHYQPEFTRLDAVREAMKILEGEHDFSAFTVELIPEKDHIRTLYRLEVKSFGPLVCLCFVGNGFLYKMVRSMTGALLEVGRGRILPQRVGEMLASKDRSMAKDTAPACGLFLMKVFYEEEEWRNFDFSCPPFFML